MKDDLELQNGMLAYYLAQARASDGNIEPRLEREPFDYREYLRRTNYPSPVSDAAGERFDPRPVKSPPK